MGTVAALVEERLGDLVTAWCGDRHPAPTCALDHPAL